MEAAAPQTKIKEKDLKERDSYVRVGKRVQRACCRHTGANNSGHSGAERRQGQKEAVPSRCAGKHRMNIETDVVGFKGSTWISCDCRTPPFRDVRGPRSTVHSPRSTSSPRPVPYPCLSPLQPRTPSPEPHSEQASTEPAITSHLCKSSQAAASPKVQTLCLCCWFSAKFSAIRSWFSP